MFIQNEHIYLRALETSDLDLLYQCENDTSVWQISNTVAPFSKDVLNLYLSSSHMDIYTTKQLRLMICSFKSHECLGMIDLFEFDPTHARVGIGVLIFESFRKNGFANQAIELIKQYTFTHLHINQLYCNIGAENQASLQLFDKCGFQKVGIKKQWNRTSKNTFEDEWLLQCFK